MVRRRYYRLKHYNNMADKLEKTRVLAACHIIVGFLLVCLRYSRPYRENLLWYYMYGDLDRYMGE